MPEGDDGDGKKPAIQEIKLILKPLNAAKTETKSEVTADTVKRGPGGDAHDDISKEDVEALRRRGQLRFSQDERVNTVLKQLYGNEESPVNASTRHVPHNDVSA